MKSEFKFSNLLGTVYQQGNIIFSEDGTKLLSPVGNRVSCFDLVKNRSFTYNYEHRKNIARIAVNKQGNLLMSVDVDGRAILVNNVSRVVLHHFNFKDRVLDMKFSPNGRFLAVVCSRFLQIWKTPDLAEDRQFSPFVRHRVHSGHYNDITNINWSNDSRFIISASKDMTAKIFSLDSEEKDVKMTFSGHKDNVLSAFFNETQEVIYTLSKDGALFKWEYTENPNDSDEESAHEESRLASMNWRITEKNFFHSDAKVTCSTFHSKSGLLIVGFANGEFRVYELPDFNLIQSLSMGQNAVNSVSVNQTGEWMAFGSSKLGQLLVYEWQSESYVLKQQGHFDSVNALCYSPDGSRIVTAADDGKIKIWDVASGFCLITLSEHISAVTDVKFAKKGQILFSASLDGTVRAWDLIRFRNFRTFTATERIKFNCLAVDPSGEIVVAGSNDSFEIYVWSVQTAQLLDSLTGHEGPISCLALGTESATLASASWDKTIRLWDIFGRSSHVEPIEVTSDVLSLALRPDSKEVAVSTLDGHIAIFDTETASQLHLIDGKRDIIAGRYMEDRFTSHNSARAKYFTTINYSFDGSALIAGGINNSLCLYDISNEVLLKRFTVSQNMTLNGTQQMLNSKNMTDGGPLNLIDNSGEHSDLEDRLDSSLPGSHRGDPTARNTRPEIRVSSIQFSPTSSAFAAASTEGLLIYSIDESVIFDPFELDVDITPDAIVEVLKEKEFLTALVMAFRLNEHYLIYSVYESIPVNDIQLVASSLPVVYVNKLLGFIGEILTNDENKHLEFNILWIKSVLQSHGKYINANKAEFASSLKLIQRFLGRVAKSVVDTSKKNSYSYEYLTSAKLSQNVSGATLETSKLVDPAADSESDADIQSMHDSDDEEGWFGPLAELKYSSAAIPTADAGSDDDMSDSVMSDV